MMNAYNVENVEVGLDAEGEGAARDGLHRCAETFTQTSPTDITDTLKDPGPSRGLAASTLRNSAVVPFQT